MTAITFVTGNKGKYKEVAALLNKPLEQSDLVIEEIQSLDLAEIAHHKAVTAFQKIHKPLFVDDTGLAVAAWNGFPGPFIKHIQKAGGMELLLSMLKHTINREANFITTLAFHDGSQVHTFVGSVKGTIASEIRGNGGWGIDGIFIPEGHVRTYAEMEFAEKNSLSHRTKAVMLFKDYLEQNPT